jgi:hypothetical protein
MLKTSARSEAGIRFVGKSTRTATSHAATGSTSTPDAKRKEQKSTKHGDNVLLVNNGEWKKSSLASVHAGQKGEHKDQDKGVWPPIYASKRADASILSSFPAMEGGMVPANYTVPKPTLLLLQRYTDYSSSDRDWSDKTFRRVERAVRRHFPAHDIRLISSKPSVSSSSSSSSSSSNRLLAEELLPWLTADVVIAGHGAGLTNALLLPPHALVVEISGEFTDLMMPVCGYYSPLLSLVGTQHFLYLHTMAPPFVREEGEQETDTDYAENRDFALQADDMARQAARYYRWLQEHRRLLSELPSSSHASSSLSSSPVGSSSSRLRLAPVKGASLGAVLRAPVEKESIVHRAELQSRLSVVLMENASSVTPLLFRVSNCTAGPIATRP